MKQNNLRLLQFTGFALLLILICSCSKEEKKLIVKKINSTDTYSVKLNGC